MKIWKCTAITLGALGLFYIAGCKSCDAPQSKESAQYCKIAEQLDSGGSFYSIINPTHALDGVNQIAMQLFDNAVIMRNPPENLNSILQKSLYAMLIYRLSGLEDVQGFGASSIQISKDNEASLFRNRTYLAVKPDSNGFAWSFWATQNRDLTKSWEELPAEVSAACELDIRPEKVYQILAENQKLAPFLKDRRIEALLGESPEQFLSGIAGTVRFATLRAIASDETIFGNHYVFSLPDQEQKLFNVVRKFAVLLPGTQVAKDHVKLGQVLGKKAPAATPIIRSKDQRIIVYSSAASEQAFTSPQRRLIDDEKFGRLSVGIPAAGIGFAYNTESYSDAFNWWLRELQINSTLNPNLWRVRQFTDLSREKDGFVTTGNSSLDYSQSILVNNIVLPLSIGIPFVRDYWRKRIKTQALEEERKRPDMTGECQITLELFKDALARYATSHNGEFPGQENIGGIRELLQGKLLPLPATVCPGARGVSPAESIREFGASHCSYVYFAGFDTKSNPKLPLVIDWPLNHSGAVNVLLVDGTIQKVELSAIDCKRIVSKLQTIYQYNETDFRNLIRQADKLDKKFGLDK
ncbi:MAG: hypothetical protein LBM70_02755 [Victivallales bacterium]|jgi:hypothetical protein|nr:hypothetical protein [Victivallales bacterium]